MVMMQDYGWLAYCFFAGWGGGILAEYFLHWLMHRWTWLGFHIGHHKQFFLLSAREIADNSSSPPFALAFFTLVLAAFSPLLWWSFWPVLIFWTGMVFHICIVYEFCHWTMHYDVWLPRWFTQSRPYRWWKGCHFEHHRASPAKNYCVTVPVLDWVLGTYVHPSDIPEPAELNAEHQHHA